MKRTIMQVIIDHFKEKPATDDEIRQLEKNLKREELKAKIRETKMKSKGGSGVERFLKVTDELFGKHQDTKLPRF